MATPNYIYRRGEPVTFGDRVTAGAVLPGHTMRAHMKFAPTGYSSTIPGSAGSNVTRCLTTSFVAAAGNEAAYWLHSLTAEQSLALPAGDYWADSALLLDGEVVQISESMRVTLRESVTGAAE